MNYFSSYQLLPFKGRSWLPPALLMLLITVLFCSQRVQAQVGDEADSISIEAPVEDQPVAGYEKTVISEPLVYRHVPDSVTSKLKKQKEFAYANDARYW